MAQYNRSEHLKQLHAQRKSKTLEKVNEAIKTLIRKDENINFNTVSKEATISKATLYNTPEIREKIEGLRQQQFQLSPKRKREIQEIEDNNKVMIESLKRKIMRMEKEYKEKISKLEQEKKELTGKLQVAYGLVYQKNS